MIGQDEKRIIVRLDLITINNKESQPAGVSLDVRYIICRALQEAAKEMWGFYFEKGVILRNLGLAQSTLHEFALTPHLVTVASKCDHILTTTPESS
jgi:hypothetical protein